MLKILFKVFFPIFWKMSFNMVAYGRNKIFKKIKNVKIYYNLLWYFKRKYHNKMLTEQYSSLTFNRPIFTNNYSTVWIPWNLNEFILFRTRKKKKYVHYRNWLFHFRNSSAFSGWTRQKWPFRSSALQISQQDLFHHSKPTFLILIHYIHIYISIEMCITQKKIFF